MQHLLDSLMFHFTISLKTNGMMVSVTVITPKMQHLQDGRLIRHILLMTCSFSRILLLRLLKMHGTRLWKSFKICILMSLHIMLMQLQQNCFKVLVKDMILLRMRLTNWHQSKKQLFSSH